MTTRVEHSSGVTPPALEDGLVHKSVLISDLVASTQLVEDLGDEHVSQVFSRHDRAARDLMEKHGGREIDKTDGFLILFGRPIHAVLYSLAYHRALADLSEELGIELNARVAVHFGEMYLRTNSPDDVRHGAKPLEVEGLAKPLTARVMSLAQGRQTLLTRGAYDLARRSAVDLTLSSQRELTWLAHGDYLVKGMTETIDVFEVGVPGQSHLAAPTGSAKVRRVEERGRGKSPSILVFPFESLSPNGQDKFLTEGLTEQTIADLSKLDALRVLARTSAAKLLSATQDLKSIGLTLHVKYVVEGRVMRAGDRLRITAKILETETEELLWADKFEGSPEDIFDLQEEISRAIVGALKVEVSASENARLGERPIPNIQAYEYYLLAKREITRFREDSLETAQDYLRRGIEILGDNILLMSGMGYLYWQYFNAGMTTDRGYLDKAKTYAERILELDPESAHGHRLIGLVGMHEGDLQRVVFHLRRALRRDPNDTDTLFWLPLIYSYIGKSTQGYALVERLLQIDPLTPFYNCLPGWLLLMEGEFDLAPESLLKSYNMDPESPLLRFCYGHSLAMAGRKYEADKIFDLFSQDMPDNFFTSLAKFARWSLSGDRQQALAAATEDLKVGAFKDLQYSWHMAAYYALINEKQEALTWLENSVDRGFINYPLISELDPFLENIRGESRFRDLMTKVKRRWRDLAA